ncbi:MAG: DUF3325 domain-containing protein [Pseudomonadota bacterium]
MEPAVLLIFAFLSALLGCVLLAVTQIRHWKTLFGPRAEPGHVRVARTMGWSLIAMSLVLCVLRDGASFGALLWPLTLAVAAFCTAMMLAYRPQWLKPLADLFAQAR